jgi:hypothetical protein
MEGKMISKSCNKFHYFLFVIIILVLGACSKGIAKKNVIGDGGLISGKPCLPPCFFGIIPGTTTKNQVIEILKQNGLNIIGNIDSPPSWFDNGFGAEFNTSGILDNIGFTPTKNITVQMVIDEYGHPDSVAVPFNSMSLPESPEIDMGLYINKFHIYLVLQTRQNYAYPLTPDSLVSEVVYFDGTTYDHYLLQDEHITEWKGYDSYEDPKPYRSSP